MARPVQRCASTSAVAATALVASCLYVQSAVFVRGSLTTRSARIDKIETAGQKRRRDDKIDRTACTLRKTADKIDTVGRTHRVDIAGRTHRADKIDTAGSTLRRHRVDKIGAAGSMRKREDSRIRNRTGGRGRNRRPRANRRRRNTAYSNRTIELEPEPEQPLQLRDPRQGPPVPCTFYYSTWSYLLRNTFRFRVAFWSTSKRDERL
jgi:hypothetical protein